MPNYGNYDGKGRRHSGLSHEELHTRKKKSRKGLLIFLAVIAAAAIFTGFSAYEFHRYFALSNYVSDEEVLREAVLEAEHVGTAVYASADMGGSPGGAPEGNADALLQAIGTLSGDSKDGKKAPMIKDVYNLLLVGVDRRDSSWFGNADSIILISVDRNRKVLNMISFMRDLYADIPGYGVQKINAACALGGCPLLVKTLEANYGVSIDNYISLDYGGMVAMIDAIGGVQIEVTDEEAELANGLIRDMTTFLGGDPSEHYFSGGGSCLADGFQATAYSRIRFVGNNDYERTKRQRIVMTKILEKVKNMDFEELGAFALKVLPELTHNIDPVTMLLLIPLLPQFAKYDISESRVPYDGLYRSEGEILIPEMEETKRRIHETIYGTPEGSGQSN